MTTKERDLKDAIIQRLAGLDKQRERLKKRLDKLFKSCKHENTKILRTASNISECGWGDTYEGCTDCGKVIKPAQFFWYPK